MFWRCNTIIRHASYFYSPTYPAHLFQRSPYLYLRSIFHVRSCGIFVSPSFLLFALFRCIFPIADFPAALAMLIPSSLHTVSPYIQGCIRRTIVQPPPNLRHAFQDYSYLYSERSLFSSLHTR